jgi:hypothetical protein
MKLLHFILSTLQYSLFCRQVIGNRYFYSDSESTIGKLSSFQNPEGRPAPRVAQVWVPRIGRGAGATNLAAEKCSGLPRHAVTMRWAAGVQDKVNKRAASEPSASRTESGGIVRVRIQMKAQLIERQ